MNPRLKLLESSNQPEMLPANRSVERTGTDITISKARNQEVFTSPSISSVERAALNPSLVERLQEARSTAQEMWFMTRQILCQN